MKPNHIQHICSELADKIKLKNFSQETFSGYKSSLILFYLHFKRDIKTISVNEMNRYFLTLTPHAHHNCVAALKFYFRNCLNSDKCDVLKYPKLPEVIKPVLSESEIKLLIETAKNIKHKTWIMLAYTTGMRVAETIDLKWKHIFRSSMEILVKGGKGNKDRKVKLTQTMLEQLEKYCREIKCKDSEYVFRGQNNAPQYTRESVQNFLKRYGEQAGIKKKITPHVIRASAITHLDNLNVQESVIQEFAGHKKFETTRQYMRRNITEKIPDLL